MKPVKNANRVWRQDTLSNEILSWWKQFRPVDWTHYEHVESPTVNTGNDYNRRLSKIAAQIMRSRFNRRLPFPETKGKPRGLLVIKSEVSEKEIRKIRRQFGKAQGAR